MAQPVANKNYIQIKNLEIFDCSRHKLELNADSLNALAGEIAVDVGQLFDHPCIGRCGTASNTRPRNAGLDFHVDIMSTGIQLQRLKSENGRLIADGSPVFINTNQALSIEDQQLKTIQLSILEKAERCWQNFIRSSTRTNPAEGSHQAPARREDLSAPRTPPFAARPLSPSAHSREVQELKERIDELRQQIGELEQSLELEREDTERLQDQNYQLASDMRSTQEELAHLKAAQKELLQAKNTLQQRLSESEKTLKGTQDQLVHTRNQSAEDMEEAGRRFEELNRKVQHLIEEQTKQLAQLQKSHLELIREKEAQIDDLNAEILNLRKEINAFREVKPASSQEDIHKIRDKYEKALAQKELELASLRQSYQESIAFNRQKTKDLNDLRQAQRQLEETNASLTGAENSTLLEEKEAEISALKKDQTELQKQHEKKTQEQLDAIYDLFGEFIADFELEDVKDPFVLLQRITLKLIYKQRFEYQELAEKIKNAKGLKLNLEGGPKTQSRLDARTDVAALQKELALKTAREQELNSLLSKLQSENRSLLEQVAALTSKKVEDLSQNTIFGLVQAPAANEPAEKEEKQPQPQLSASSPLVQTAQALDTILGVLNTHSEDSKAFDASVYIDSEQQRQRFQLLRDVFGLDHIERINLKNNQELEVELTSNFARDIDLGLENPFFVPVLKVTALNRLKKTWSERLGKPETDPLIQRRTFFYLTMGKVRHVIERSAAFDPHSSADASWLAAFEHFNSFCERFSQASSKIREDSPVALLEIFLQSATEADCFDIAAQIVAMNYWMDRSEIKDNQTEQMIRKILLGLQQILQAAELKEASPKPSTPPPIRK